MIPALSLDRDAVRFAVRACCAFAAVLWSQVAPIRAESYAPPLRPDLRRDCRIDLHDLAVLAQRWLELDDVNNPAGLGLIDAADLALLAQQWLGRAPGQSNGVQEFWINGRLEARRTGLNFVGTYTGHGINAIFLENYWNAGSPKLQERYFDSFVVSTERIGCLCAVDPNSVR